MCRCNIASRQQQLKDATIALKQVEEAFKVHERTLQTHAAAIRARRKELTAHENAQAEYQRGNMDAGLPP